MRLVRVAGQSMAPTYRPSDLLVTRSAGRGGVRVGRGDVVVLRHDGVRMVKRVVGVAGDLVELEAGRLRVNGEPVDGRPRRSGACTQVWTVPERSYFVAGDHAEVSDDSRVWDEPFVGAASVSAVVVRRLTPRLLTPRLLTPRRRGGAGAQRA